MLKNITEQEFKSKAQEIKMSQEVIDLCLDPKNIIIQVGRPGPIEENCDICKEVIALNSIVVNTDLSYCHLKCLTLICGFCLTKFPIFSNQVIYQQNDLVCKSCVGNLVTCTDCGAFFKKNVLKAFDNQLYCAACLQACGRCHGFFPRVMCLVIRGSRICKECGQRDIWVKPHDFNPLTVLQFQGNPKNHLFFGVELEVEAKDVKECVVLAQDIVKTFGKHLIIKHDGSLKDRGQSGLEIVTAPGEFSFQRDLWKKFFEKKYRFDSANSERCSTHVHISKQALKSVQQARMANFMYAPTMRDLLQFIANRDLTTPWGNRYSSIIHKVKYTDIVEVYGGNSWFKREFNINDESMNLPPAQRTIRLKETKITRYSALNMTNPYTVEVRIFNGTSSYSGMMRKIEFCQAMIDYCMPGQCSLSELINPSKFLTFIENNRGDYPNLYQFLNSQGKTKRPPITRTIKIAI